MLLWLAAQPLVLASKSDIRGKILAAAGLRFEIRPAQIDERAVEAAAKPEDAVAAARLLARAKAEAVSATVAGRPVLGADQTLARGIHRFTKPKDRAEATEQLRALRGRTHELHSALADVIADTRTDIVLLAGKEMKALAEKLPQGMRKQHRDNVEEIIPLLLKTVRPGDAVMVKSSNGLGFSRLVDALVRHYPAASHK